MSITEDAKRELELCNFEEGEMAVILQIMGIFFKQWDSGGAVGVMLPVLLRCMTGRPLKSLTGKDDEWHDPLGDGRMWQNKRCGTVFRKRLGTGDWKAWDIERPEGHTVTFPYYPPDCRL